ncbi:ATP-binding protein [Pseudomonas sivasensis]|uniref:AAA family ATPase n=1 Tax=Pseudomonas sivasensis TaxID=1880678 RepID=UPI0021A9E1B9|nr:ATP-binding protein [Pseudomonas sivasensis]MCT4501342.1 ATP-binding protein [Pseudomonas sivasensis]
MDESHIWLSELLERAQNSHLQGSMTEAEIQQALLYTLAVQIVDWDNPKWIREQETRYWMTYDTTQDLVHLLMECCGRREKITVGDTQAYDELSELLDDVTEQLDGEEWSNLFDSLFYHIATRTGFDRRHARISGALATGLAHGAGLIDLEPYSGEAFIQHFELYQGNFEYTLVDSKTAPLDLTRLRLIVHGVDAELIDDAPDKVRHTGLALLDDPAYLSLPFDSLLQRLKQSTLPQRTLMVFKAKSFDKPSTLDALRKHLNNGDLLEAVFDFTSYNDAGKATRYCAWLLNRKKHHRQKTLCVDTRQLLGSAYGVTEEELGYFAAAICAVWCSSEELRLSLYPRSKLLGSLQGLFAQWFDSGYQDVDDVCTVLSSKNVLKSAISAKRVTTGAHNQDFSLLDRRPLERLLKQSGCPAMCAYVIGNNGAGKSLLLASLVEHLQQQSTACAAIVIGPVDRFALTDRQKYPDYRYLGDRTSTGYSSQNIERKLIDLLIEAVKIPGRFTLLEHVLERLGLKQRLYLAPKGAFNALLQPLDLADKIIPLTSAVDERIQLRNLTLALVRQNHSNLLKFTDLSSGEQQVLLLFGKIMASAGPGKVLLIDEPEVSLHVGWQQLLPSLFSLMAEQLQTRFVVATHSPTLIANAQDRLSHCFMAKDNQLTEIAPEQRRSVETILLKGFETYTPHNREIAERCAALVTEAIRATNRGESDDYAEQHEDLKRALGDMSTIMSTSGNIQDTRYQQDLQLIEHAAHAIAETFTLAQQEAKA